LLALHGWEFRRSFKASERKLAFLPYRYYQTDVDGAMVTACRYGFNAENTTPGWRRALQGLAGRAILPADRLSRRSCRLSGNSARTGRATRLSRMLRSPLPPRVAARALSGNSARPRRTARPGVVAESSHAAARAARALKGGNGLCTKNEGLDQAGCAASAEKSPCPCRPVGLQLKNRPQVTRR